MTDVARAAACSQATVSVVLAGDEDMRISAATRNRIFEAVAALGYQHQPSPRRVPPRAGARSAIGPTQALRAGTFGDGAAPSRSHTARLVDELGRRIVSGQYGEHTILPGDAEFMGEFGVSRTVLREAIKTLSGKGLVYAKARVGTRVRARPDWHLFDPDVLNWHADAGFDASFLVSLGEMRLALEPEAAALAALRHRPEQLPELYGWVEKMGAAGISRAAFVDADLNFHLTVAQIAANPFLRAISTLIEVALVAALTKSSPVDERGGVAASVAAHRAIADAIASRDADAARMAMRVVIFEGVRRASDN